MTGTHDDESDVRHALTRLVDDEPGFGLGVDDVVRDGRRLRRRRAVRVGVPVAALAVVSAAGGVSLAAGGGHDEPARAYVAAAAALPLADAGKVTGAPTPEITSAHGLALEAAIRGASPDGWTFALGQTDVGVPTLEGTVDDGSAPSNVSVSVTNTPGMLTVHPCSDPEFVAGGSCRSTPLGGGEYLNVRGVADYKGVRTIIVSITRDDGTGTFAEAGNFTLPPQPARISIPKVISGAEAKRKFMEQYGPVISRSDPVYDTAQLTAVIKAVAEVSKDWKTEPYLANGR